MSVQAKNTRERLIEAAKKVFSEKGFFESHISHIIEEAGTARGTFYIYFESKEEIFKEILKEIVEELKRRIKPINVKEDPASQIVRNIERVLDFAVEERELSKIILLRSYDTSFSTIVDEFFKEVTEMVKISLEKGILMGYLKPVNTEIIAQAMVGAVKEIMKNAIEKGNIDTYMVAKELVEFALGGLWDVKGRR